MKGKIIIILGVLIQIYFVITWIYALNTGNEYKEQQTIFNSFWSLFSDPFSALVFLFFVTGIVIFIAIQSLHTGGHIILKSIFLILEFLFLAYIGWGML